MATSWCILRCQGRVTLRLAETLAKDGFETWTPVRTQVIRKPSMNVRREVKLPLLPSFVFARASHLFDLLELANMEEKPRRAQLEPGEPKYHCDFWVFRAFGGIQLVADQELDPLRDRESRTAPKKDYVRFDRGAKVRVTGSVYAGLAGRVERAGNGYTLVIFEGDNKRTRIHTWLLAEDEANNAPKAERAPRHRNAAKYLEPEAQVGKAPSAKCGSMVEKTGREAA